MVAPRERAGGGTEIDVTLRNAPLTMVIAALVAALLASCGQRDERNHYERALAIEREMLRRNPEAGYGDQGYVSVLRELGRVRRSAPERDRARMWERRIEDGRRFAVMQAIPQAGHLPRRLRGMEPPHPPRPGDSVTPAPQAPIGGGSPPSEPPSPAADAMAEVRAAQGTRGPDADRVAGLHITMYSTSWCGYCSAARRWFGERGWPFVERNIEQDEAAARDFRRIARPSGGVPVIVVGEQVLRGFDPARIERAVATELAAGR